MENTNAKILYNILVEKKSSSVYINTRKNEIGFTDLKKPNESQVFDIGANLDCLKIYQFLKSLGLKKITEVNDSLRLLSENGLEVEIPKSNLDAIVDFNFH